MDLLRFATAGSVDEGKSTLIGRLLLDSKAIFEDQLEAVEATSQSRGYDYTDLALLTDGLNTQDRWYSSQSSIDTRQQMTCNNAKAAGIIVYAIQVNTGSDPTSTLLQNCATDSSKFFLLTSADQIVTTFQQIGTALIGAAAGDARPPPLLTHCSMYTAPGRSRTDPGRARRRPRPRRPG